jgi:hypothetical protein
MRSSVLLMLALVMSCTAFSQGTFKPAYIVKNSGDTVRGYIEEGNENKISATVSFKKNIVETSAQSFTVADLIAFGFDGLSSTQAAAMVPAPVSIWKSTVTATLF